MRGIALAGADGLTKKADSGILKRKEIKGAKNGRIYAWRV